MNQDDLHHFKSLGEFQISVVVVVELNHNIYHKNIVNIKQILNLKLKASINTKWKCYRIKQLDHEFLLQYHQACKNINWNFHWFINFSGWIYKITPHWLFIVTDPFLLGRILFNKGMTTELGKSQEQDIFFPRSVFMLFLSS